MRVVDACELCHMKAAFIRGHSHPHMKYPHTQVDIVGRRAGDNQPRLLPRRVDPESQLRSKAALDTRSDTHLLVKLAGFTRERNETFDVSDEPPICTTPKPTPQELRLQPVTKPQRGVQVPIGSSELEPLFEACVVVQPKRR